ncbi:MAG: PIN domain-containing protein [Armatimonadetes bacterium]|nr:PIN domain-containing protein [Armatimonadota bacterium]
MSDRAFVDTNILVYAHDRGAGDKHVRAKELVERLWLERSGVLSTQVLQEFYVNVRRKALSPIPIDEAKHLIEDYLTWDVVINDGDSILEAMGLEDRYGLSFWDALILQAAHRSGSETLYSEDFNSDQVYGSIQVLNPLAPRT